MKKQIRKNYIAFTLMEMTLVLLITSVIAAASTPIVTSAVSDYADKNYGASDSESADAPWRKASSYDGGGIYNSPIETASPIGINVKFGSAASNYGYPALAIESLSQNNIFNAPQIQVMNPNFASGFYTNLAMDEFENLSFVSGAESYYVAKAGNGTNTNYIGNKNIFMGDMLQTYSTLDLDDMYYKNSIILGQNINTRMNENTIAIGSNINRRHHERNVITIGQNLKTETYSNTYEGAINIGNYSDNRIGINAIRIGNYASVDSSYNKDISIGNYAGMNFGYGTIGFVGQSGYTQDDILIGKYAGAYIPNSSSAQFSMLMLGVYNNIMIGGYAGYSSVGGTASRSSSNTIIIGERAGNVNSTASGSMGPYYRDIKIGHYVGYQTSSIGESRENILIGMYAAQTNNNGYSNVIIGARAAENAQKLTDSIIIGMKDKVNFSVGTGELIGDSSGSKDVIAIGHMAGAYARGKYGALSIGSYAGFNSGQTLGKTYGNVGIGVAACNNVAGHNKWCLGWGGQVTSGNAKIYSSTSSSTYFWDSSSDTPQMFIGYAAYSSNASEAYQNTAITLYANSVYRPGTGTSGAAINFDVFKYSDKRFKTDIVPFKNALTNLRKINIYDYNMKNDENKTPKIGVIAQEYKNVYPQEVKIEPNTDMYAVGTDWLIYSMVEAIKELDKNVQNVQNKFDNYVKDFMGLKSRVARLEKQAQIAKQQNAQIKSRLAKINAR